MAKGPTKITNLRSITTKILKDNMDNSNSNNNSKDIKWLINLLKAMFHLKLMVEDSHIQFMMMYMLTIFKQLISLLD